MTSFTHHSPPPFDGAVYDRQGEYCGRIRELYCEPSTGQVLFADIETQVAPGSQICVSMHLLELEQQISGFVLRADPIHPDRR